MAEGWRIAVELLPISFGQQRLELLEHRRAGIRGENLELCKRRTEVNGVVDRRGNRVPVVLKETENVKRGGHDPALATVFDDMSLVRFRNRSASRFLQRGWRQ